MVAAAIAGAAVVGAGTSLVGSSEAAGSAKDAAALQAQTQAAAVARAAPFVATGTSAANQLSALNTNGFTAGQPDYLSLAASSVPDANTVTGVENTPGYQFNLQQGLNAVQNSASARGLGVSGAAMKGAASYATGLADSTYQNQFANQQTKQQDYLNLNTGQQSNAMNLFNRLAGTTTIGANAAGGLGTSGAASAAVGGNYLNQAGLADAAGASGVGNALSGAANSYVGLNYLQQLQGGSQIGSSGIYTGGANGVSSGTAASVAAHPALFGV